MEASPRPDKVGLQAGLRLPEVQPRPPPTYRGSRESGNVPFPHPWPQPREALFCLKVPQPDPPE